MPEPKPYIALKIKHDQETSPVWLLELFDVEGIESTANVTKAYWPKDQWKNINEKLVSELKKNSFTDFQVVDIPFVNWNAEWEANFQPIRISDFCFIRAPFHPPVKGVKFEIVIDPKMAFGTGHHATTWQMIEQMSHLDLENLSVLDYGAGTGILSILAKKMQASDVLAIDNDPLAVENMKENFLNNDCPEIVGQLANLEELDNGNYDLILANINRNVILESVDGITRRAKPKAELLISGFYAEELPLLTERYEVHWECLGHTVKEQWCCAHFQRK